jgi:hypothetical protein
MDYLEKMKFINYLPRIGKIFIKMKFFSQIIKQIFSSYLNSYQSNLIRIMQRLMGFLCMHQMWRDNNTIGCYRPIA